MSTIRKLLIAHKLNSRQYRLIFTTHEQHKMSVSADGDAANWLVYLFYNLLADKFRIFTSCFRARGVTNNAKYLPTAILLTKTNANDQPKLSIS